jgi:hypothetical protein
LSGDFSQELDIIRANFQRLLVRCLHRTGRPRAGLCKVLEVCKVESMLEAKTQS